MFELLTIAIGAEICLAGFVSYRRTRDPLSPMVVFSLMLLYLYVYRPLMMFYRGSLESLFPDVQQLEVVQLINVLSIGAFCLGCLAVGRVTRVAGNSFVFVQQGITPRVRQRLVSAAFLLGVIAGFVFWSMVFHSGGPVKVFSLRKPFLTSPVNSGYYRDLVMLCYPAAILLAGSWQGQGLTPKRVLLLLLMVSPDLVMATFGGRRGAMFLITSTLALSWCIVHSRRPNLRWMLAGMSAVGLVMLLLSVNRSNLFRPWEEKIQFTVLEEKLSGEAATAGDEFVCAAAVVLAARETRTVYWGKRYVATLFVRPLPKQFWPTKYEDLGMSWMVDRPGTAGFSDAQWMSTVGFVPAGGSAIGFVSDMFLEFSWAGILGCFVLGRMYSWSWNRWTTRGGVWTIIYLEMLATSVYLASQSVGAFLSRFIFLAVPTYLVWALLVRTRQSAKQRRPWRPTSAQVGHEA